MSNAGAVVGAIAAHTVITSTIRNQQADNDPVENTMTEAELSQASHDFMAGFVKQATWGFGIMIGIMAVIAGLIWIFG